MLEQFVCSHRASQLSGRSDIHHHDAKPVTPPKRAGPPKVYTCTVDYDHKPYSIMWSGTWEYPDLTGFPALQNVAISPVDQTSSMTAIWRVSTLLDYGSHALIRSTNQSQYPLVKLAHADTASKELIRHEFNILADLTTRGLPVVNISPQPILDNGIICGYQMERLFKLDISELCMRRQDIEDAVTQLHSEGFCHGDISPSNIMVDSSGRIVLIDFSFAGRIQSPVPHFFPEWIYRDSNGIFSPDVDLEALRKYIAQSNFC